ALHRPSERHTLHELVGDAVGDELPLDLRALHLLDIDRHLVRRKPPELVTQLVDPRSALAHHDTRSRGVDRYDHRLRLALDLHLRERRMPQSLVQVLPDPLVLGQELRKVALGIPAGLPGAYDAESKPSRVSFLSHAYSLRSTTIVT